MSWQNKSNCMQHEWHKNDQRALAAYLSGTRNKLLDLIRQDPPIPLGINPNSPPSEPRLLGQWEGFHAALAAIEALSLEESAKKEPEENEQQTEVPPNLDKD